MKTYKMNLRVNRNNEIKIFDVIVDVNDNGTGNVNFNGKKVACELTENTMQVIDQRMTCITCTASNKVVNGVGVMVIDIFSYTV